MEFILDAHIHTIASGHAYSTIMETAACAASKGLALIAITDHGPAMPGASSKVYFSNLNILPKEINGVKLLTGAEANIMDISGTLDMSDRLLSKLDVIIASMHSLCIKPMSAEENTEAVINTIKNPYVKIIGHLGDPRFPVLLDPIIDACVENNTFLEINNASLCPNSIRAGSEKCVEEILEKCKRRGYPVILGTDAHFCALAGDFSCTAPYIEQASMPPELVINTSLSLFNEMIIR